MTKVNVNKADSRAALISERSTNLFLLYVEKVTSLITRYTMGLRMNLRNLLAILAVCAWSRAAPHPLVHVPSRRYSGYKVHKMLNVVQSETAAFSLHSAITKTGFIFITGAAMFVLVVQVHYICLNRTLEYRG